MLKPNVMCDIDGVLADCDGPFYAELAKRGFPLDRRENTHYHAANEQLQTIHNHSQEEAQALLADIFWREGFVSTLPVRLDAVRALPMIGGIANQIHMVTARDTTGRPHVIKETTLWLERFGFSYNTLAFEKDKITYCREKGMAYVIEDAPHTAEMAYRHGYGVFLVNHTYNQHVAERARLWRVDSLCEIPEIMARDWSTVLAMVKS